MKMIDTTKPMTWKTEVLEDEDPPIFLGKDDFEPRLHFACKTELGDFELFQTDLYGVCVDKPDADEVYQLVNVPERHEIWLRFDSDLDFVTFETHDDATNSPLFDGKQEPPYALVRVSFEGGQIDEP